MATSLMPSNNYLRGTHGKTITRLPFAAMPGCAKHRPGALGTMPFTTPSQIPMNDALSADEYAALSEILKLQKGSRPSACVARNTKRLAGMKYIRLGKSGHPELTDLGRQTLFIKQCVDGLRELASDPLAVLEPPVARFLEQKGHARRDADTGQLLLTERGRDTLADIERTSA